MENKHIEFFIYLGLVYNYMCQYERTTILGNINCKVISVLMTNVLNTWDTPRMYRTRYITTEFCLRKKTLYSSKLTQKNTLLHLYASKPKLSVVSCGSKWEKEIVDGQCDIVLLTIKKCPRAFELESSF